MSAALLGFLESYLQDLAKYRVAVKEIEDELMDAEPLSGASRYVGISEETYGRMRAYRLSHDDDDLFPGLNEREIRVKVRSSKNLSMLDEAADAVALERGLKEPHFYDYDDRGLHLSLELQGAIQSWALQPKRRFELDMLAEYIELGADAYNEKYLPYTNEDFTEH